MLHAISPIDGRYASKTKALQAYYSESALISYRVRIEIEYFIQLVKLGLPELSEFPKDILPKLLKISDQFGIEDAREVKAIEKTTNHDVKAVEYYLKEQFDQLGIGRFKEFIHFGLTSQDINNSAVPLLIKDSLAAVVFPLYQSVIVHLHNLAEENSDTPMLCRTHGQPASPSILGKELFVFVFRLKEQFSKLQHIELQAKFGGAVGNFNAHVAAYPAINWMQFGDDFIHSLGLKRQAFTTQIENYDVLAELFHNFIRLNTVLIDLCRDIWTYISIEYFKQKIVAGEVGSSTMPHKVNPIDFENAEGNLGFANAQFDFLSRKLPVSRLQRDLTDSTVSRNIGVPIGHTVIALQSLLKGLGKIEPNPEVIAQDLEKNWLVLAEAYQSILRREGIDQPYELLKALTRTGDKIGRPQLMTFIDELPIESAVKDELRQLTPSNYVGVFPPF